MTPLLAVAFTILAQVDPNSALETFKSFLAKIALLIGVVVITYGGFLIARGHQLEGVMCIIGGFLIAIAVPLITYLAQLGGVTF